MAKRNRTRSIISVAIVLLVGGSLVAAFWPRPLLVDFAEVQKGPMEVTIDEEGRTRVHDSYVLSTPVAGRLLRVNVQPGDSVNRGETIVAQMRPINPAVLDARTREQANATVSAAEAALRLARADLNAALADQELADSDYDRAIQLYERDRISEAVLERAENTSRSAAARLDTTQAAIAMRQAELDNAHAHLISFDSPGSRAVADSDAIPLYAPVDGRILQIMQQSETTLPAGTPIMEIGDIETDLEVVVQLISSDAVQVSEGDPVRIEDWGGHIALPGVVRRVEPFGITKYSTLGVEEQRVDVLVEFTGPPEERSSLGHGYRVEARIVVWSEDEAIIVPSSALFRKGSDWSVFRVVDGQASVTSVELGRNNGVRAQVMAGLDEGDVVVVYPPAALVDGTAVARRTIE